MNKQIFSSIKADKTFYESIMVLCNYLTGNHKELIDKRLEEINKHIISGINTFYKGEQIQVEYKSTLEHVLFHTGWSQGMSIERDSLFSDIKGLEDAKQFYDTVINNADKWCSLEKKAKKAVMKHYGLRKNHKSLEKCRVLKKEFRKKNEKEEKMLLDYVKNNHPDEYGQFRKHLPEYYYVSEFMDFNNDEDCVLDREGQFTAFKYVNHGKEIVDYEPEYKNEKYGPYMINLLNKLRDEKLEQLVTGFMTTNFIINKVRSLQDSIEYEGMGFW